MDIFAKVDENFSGDLDVNEWIRLFTSLNESVPVLEARMIFMKIDKDSDGFLTMRELIPVVFNKATQVSATAVRCCYCAFSGWLLVNRAEQCTWRCEFVVEVTTHAALYWPCLFVLLLGHCCRCCRCRCCCCCCCCCYGTYAAIHVALTCDNAPRASVYVSAVTCLLREDTAFTSHNLFHTS
jgi:hypothetical protein